MVSVNLPSITLGGRKIRYIQFRGPNSFGSYVVPQPSDLTLFVASDVLSAGPVQHANNHSRIHARFAKEGYATRATLEGVRLAGTRNSSVMWFYTVVGLFKVVFEYLPLNMQSDCLQQLKALWLSQSAKADQLPEEITLHFSDGLATSGQNSVVAKHTHCGVESETSHGPMKCQSTPLDLDISAEAKIHEIVRNDHEDLVFHPVAPSSTHSKHPHAAVGVNVTDDTATDGEAEIIVFVAESPPQEPTQTQQNSSSPDQDKPSSVRDILQHIHSFIRSKLPLYRSDSRDCRLLTRVVMALDYFREECLDENSDSGCDILEKIMVRHTELKKDYATRDSAESFGLSKCTHTMLYAVSECLGQAYNSLAAAIMNNVEQFKKDHIGHIDDLPSPHSLVNQLFPECMQVLLLQWMVPHGIRYPEDHSYSPPLKKIRAGEKEYEIEKLYPFIQLILEFTNNTLITGVAHVLYTRLLQNNSSE